MPRKGVNPPAVLPPKGPNIAPGYFPIATLSGPYPVTANALRLMALRGQIRAIRVRNRVFAYEPDLQEIFEPKVYPPIRADDAA